MLKLIRYNENLINSSDIWFWADEDDCLAGPIFENEQDAWDWFNSKQ